MRPHFLGVLSFPNLLAISIFQKMKKPSHPLGSATRLSASMFSFWWCLSNQSCRLLSWPCELLVSFDMGSYVLFFDNFSRNLERIVTFGSATERVLVLRRNGFSVLLRTDRKKSHFFVNKSTRYSGWFLRSKRHWSLPLPSHRTKLGADRWMLICWLWQKVR